MSVLKITSTHNKKLSYFRDLYRYITDDVKSEGLTGANGCSVKYAVQSMEIIKRLYHKLFGRQTIEITLSLTSRQKYIDDKIYLQIADKVSLLYSDYQSYYAVHKDTNIRHIHIILNSVNFKTGHKFTQSRRDLNRLKQKVNCILNDFGFDIIRINANEIWDDSEHFGTTFSHLEVYEEVQPFNDFSLDINPEDDPLDVDEPLEMENIFNDELQYYNSYSASSWYASIEYYRTNPDYPSNSNSFTRLNNQHTKISHPNHTYPTSYTCGNLPPNPFLSGCNPPTWKNPFEDVFHRESPDNRWRNEYTCPYYTNDSYHLFNYPPIPSNGWDTQNVYENSPLPSVPLNMNPTAPTWQNTPMETYLQPSNPPCYGTQSPWDTPNGYLPQQTPPNYMPQNPYPTVEISMGTVYCINASPNTPPQNITQLTQDIIRYESSQNPIPAANIGWAMQKKSQQNGMPLNCLIDSSPRIEINLIEQTTDDEDDNMVETTLADTE